MFIIRPCVIGLALLTLFVNNGFAQSDPEQSAPERIGDHIDSICARASIRSRPDASTIGDIP